MIEAKRGPVCMQVLIALMYERGNEEFPDHPLGTSEKAGIISTCCHELLIFVLELSSGREVKAHVPHSHFCHINRFRQSKTPSNVSGQMSDERHSVKTGYPEKAPSACRSVALALL